MEGPGANKGQDQTTGSPCFSIFLWKGKGPPGSSVLQGTGRTELYSWHQGRYSSSPKLIHCCDGLVVELNGRTECTLNVLASLGGVYSCPYLKLTNRLSPGDTDVRNRLLDSVGEGKGGMIWENNTETYTLSYVKQMTNVSSIHKAGHPKPVLRNKLEG